MRRVTKHAISFILCFVLILSLAACGEKETKREKAKQKWREDIPAAMLGTMAVMSVSDFAGDGMETFGMDGRKAYFRSCYDNESFTELVRDFCYIGSTGANADEVAVALAKDESDIAAIKKAFRYRLDSRKEVFNGYAPEQVKKVEKGRIETYGLYVVMLVCDEPQSTLTALERVIAGKAELTIEPPTNKPTEVPVTETPTPIMSPTPAYEEPVSYGAGYENGYNPLIVTAYQTKNPDLLTAPQDILLYQKCEAILSKLIVNRELSDADAVRLLYNYVADHIAYDYGHYSLEGEKLNSNNPYGALLDGLGICTGFSTSFQLLCTMCDIPCITVTGTANHDREAHGWNMVKLGPYWYYTDPCWGSGSKTRYYNETAEQMTETLHYWNEADYPKADTVNYQTRKKIGYEGVSESFRNPEEKHILIAR